MSFVLCGYKCCGKTSYARAFAEIYHYRCVDNDDDILSYYNQHMGSAQSIGEVYRAVGDRAFRDIESKMIADLPIKSDQVIATSGGAILNTDNVEYLRRHGAIIYLRLSKELLRQRILGAENLPAFINVLSPDDSFETYYDQRRHLYTAVADVTIDVSSLSEHEVLRQLAVYR